MEWDECIEEAKEELGIHGWTKNWDEVMDLAKEKYWEGETFKELKKEVIEDANSECELCFENKGLTVHHVGYGHGWRNICLCNECHELIHKLQNREYGFIMQLVLIYWNNQDIIFNRFPNLGRISYKCINEINREILQRE